MIVQRLPHENKKYKNIAFEKSKPSSLWYCPFYFLLLQNLELPFIFNYEIY